MVRLPDDIKLDVGSLSKELDSETRTTILGQLLFTIVMWARLLEVDPESALRETNNRFAENFRKLEQEKQADKLRELTDGDICQLWKTSS